MSNLVATPISIYELPFKNKDGIVQIGRLFYVHHALTIDSINGILKGKEFRPATIADLKGFYEAYGLIISRLKSIQLILATKEVGVIKEEEWIPCIKKGEGEEGVVSLSVHNSYGRFVTDHAGIYVLAIESREVKTALQES